MAGRKLASPFGPGLSGNIELLAMVGVAIFTMGAIDRAIGVPFVFQVVFGMIYGGLYGIGRSWWIRRNKSSESSQK